MLGSIQAARVTLTALTLLLGFGFGLPPACRAAIEPGSPVAAGDTVFQERKSDAKPATDSAAARDQTPAQVDLKERALDPGSDAVRSFVPLRPATVDDRRQNDAVRYYTVARALEDQGAFADAAALLQEALKLEPDSTAIARRLCRIYIGALARPDMAVPYGRRVMSMDPGDTDTLSQLVEYYRKVDTGSAVALLVEVLANPKLDTHAPGRLVALSELGKLYASRLNQVQKAADIYAKLLDGLDDKSAGRLTPVDQARIFGNDPAQAYLSFGMVFLAAQRNELAARALDRGLAYDEDNSQIALTLADTLVKLKKGQQALAIVERTIERQTPFVDAYELLAKVLKALHREQELTPRLEAAARRDSKNVPLQYVLADRYRETGQADKAEKLYQELLNSQRTPQAFSALAASLFKRRKAADLLKIISEAWARQESQEAIKPHILAVVADDAMSAAILDVGLQQMETDPASVNASKYVILSIVANTTGRATTNRKARLEKLLRIQRMREERNPSVQFESEIYDTLNRLGKHAEAAAALEQILKRDPNVKNVNNLVNLADLHRRAGHNEAMKNTLREAIKLDPRDGSGQRRLANLLSDIGQFDDAVRILKDAIKREPNDVENDVNLGSILIKYGKNDEAVQVFEGVLKRYADNEIVVKVSRAYLSMIYVNQGDYNKGEGELEILLERFPDDPGSNNDLGYLYAEQGKNLEKAESMIRKALSGSEKREYLDSLGWVLFKRGKVREALLPLLRAAELMRADIEQDGGNPDATIFEHLGDVYFELHDRGRAGDSWRQAAKAAEAVVPPDRRLAEIKKKLELLEKTGPMPKPASPSTP
jgi:tetratricopeptide (TPR) repeat protein